MKILIVVKSKGNTMQVAEAIAEVSPVTITSLEDVGNYNLEEYDIVGLGSGIFLGKHYKDLIKFAGTVNNKYCFVFSTSGYNDLNKVNNSLIQLLVDSGKTVLGSFSCRGAFIGINKGHPNTEDFDNAQKFINEVIDYYNKLQ